MERTTRKSDAKPMIENIYGGKVEIGGVVIPAGGKIEKEQITNAGLLKRAIELGMVKEA